MSEHTPGPWHVANAKHAGIGIAHMQDGAFRAPASASAITGRSFTDGGEGWHFIAAMNSHVQSEADARLIAAAPELLAACKAAIELSDRNAPRNDDGQPWRTPECQACYDQVAASIANAESSL